MQPPSIHLQGTEGGYDETMSYAPRKCRSRAERTTLASLLLTALSALLVQPQLTAQEIENGTLLIASATLQDPNFARSVVLVLRHDDDNGTIGLVLNRPTNLEPAKIFPELADGVGAYDGRLFRGGPISPTRILTLVRGLAAATVQGPEVTEKVFLSIDPEALADMTRLADGADELRLYAGHAAWVPGQLEGEIAAGGWELMPATAEIIFDSDPSELWPKLEGKQPAAGGGFVARAAAIR
jgi:putative transcriptional regulator